MKSHISSSMYIPGIQHQDLLGPEGEALSQMYPDMGLGCNTSWDPGAKMEVLQLSSESCYLKVFYDFQGCCTTDHWMWNLFIKLDSGEQLGLLLLHQLLYCIATALVMLLILSLKFPRSIALDLIYLLWEWSLTQSEVHSHYHGHGPKISHPKPDRSLTGSGFLL